MGDKEKYSFYKIGEEDLPSPSLDLRGQVRVKPHSVAEQGDRLMFCRLRDDGTTMAWANLTGISVQESDVTVGFGIGVLDFGVGLNVTEGPDDEANISVDLVGVRESLVLPKGGAQTASDTTSTTSTAVYQSAMQGTIILPNEGIWRIEMIGGQLLRHSTGGAINYRLLINGNAGTVRTNSSSVDIMLVADHAVTFDTSVSGTSCVVFVEYKANVAGTVNSRAPWYYATAYRTG